MPRPRRPWFRFYTEAVHDRKLRRLPPAQRWVWVVVLAMARQSPVPGYLLLASDEDRCVPLDEVDLADAAAVRPKDVHSAMVSFEKMGMLEDDPNIGAMRVAKWSERQYESDDVTERTRKHRSKEQGRNVPTSFPGTPPETETETEEENPSSDVASDADPVAKFGQQAVDLARHLGTRVQANGHKVPAKGSKAAWRWFDAMDKLIRIDGAQPAEVRHVIDWATADEFWCSNIKSAGKLREQYSSLRLRMLNDGNHTGPDPTAADDVDEHGTARGVV